MHLFLYQAYPRGRRELVNGNNLTKLRQVRLRATSLLVSGHSKAQKNLPERPYPHTENIPPFQSISCCTGSTHHLEQILVAYEPSNCPAWAATCPLERAGKRMASGSTCKCSKCSHCHKTPRYAQGLPGSAGFTRHCTVLLYYQCD